LIISITYFTVDQLNLVVNRYLFRAHAGTLPVVQVILEVPVADAKLELLQESLVLHQIQCIEDIKPFLETDRQSQLQLTKHKCNRKIH